MEPVPNRAPKNVITDEKGFYKGRMIASTNRYPECPECGKVFDIDHNAEDFMDFATSAHEMSHY